MNGRTFLDRRGHGGFVRAPAGAAGRTWFRRWEPPRPTTSLRLRHDRALKPVAKAEEDRQPLIDGSDLLPRKFTEYSPDPPLID
jgi:hypothetical protein